MSDRTPKKVTQWLPQYYFYFSGLDKKQSDGNWAVSMEDLIAKLQEVDNSTPQTLYTELDDDGELSFWYYRNETPAEIELRTRSASKRKADRIKQLERELKELKEGL